MECCRYFCRRRCSRQHVRQELVCRTTEAANSGADRNTDSSSMKSAARTLLAGAAIPRIPCSSHRSCCSSIQATICQPSPAPICANAGTPRTNEPACLPIPALEHERHELLAST